jgi:hypothetical protein
MVLMVWVGLFMLELAAFTGKKFFRGKVYMMEKDLFGKHYTCASVVISQNRFKKKVCY